MCPSVKCGIRKDIWIKSSSTCKIEPNGEAVTKEMMDQYDLDAVEDASVHEHWYMHSCECGYS